MSQVLNQGVGWHEGFAEEALPVENGFLQVPLPLQVLFLSFLDALASREVTQVSE